jgi:hypothetical protein
MDDNNFFAMDRLVEFGMGIAVAKQMADSMNHSLQSAQIPGSQTLPLAVPSLRYHIVIDGKSAGPFTEVEALRLIADGKLKRDTYVWRPGMLDWDLAENVADILKLVALAPPPFKSES